MLHANFNTGGNYSETQNDIICKLLYALWYISVLIFGASYNGDKSLIITFCKEFYEGVAAELNSKRTPDLIKCCKYYEGPVPCADPLHLPKRVRPNARLNNSVVYHGRVSVLRGNILNEATIQAATDLTSRRILGRNILCG